MLPNLILPEIWMLAIESNSCELEVRIWVGSQYPEVSCTHGLTQLIIRSYKFIVGSLELEFRRRKLTTVHRSWKFTILANAFLNN